MGSHWDPQAWVRSHWEPQGSGLGAMWLEGLRAHGWESWGATGNHRAPWAEGWEPQGSGLGVTGSHWEPGAPLGTTGLGLEATALRAGSLEITLGLWDSGFSA